MLERTIVCWAVMEKRLELVVFVAMTKHVATGKYALSGGGLMSV